MPPRSSLGREERAFIGNLISDPRFSERVNDIVVEFGNARFQGIVDRYVAGEDVPASELRGVWREHTCPGPWSSSAYPKYFARFREVNQALPPARRLRVLLGDPPIDWQAVRTPQEFGRILERRDSHFARVVEQQVLAKGRRALLIIGGLHLLRKEPRVAADFGPNAFGKPPAGALKMGPSERHFSSSAYTDGPDEASVAQLIERRYPGKLFILLPHDGLGDGSVVIDKRIRRWHIPSLAPLSRTWLGAVAADQILPGPKMVKMYVDGKVVDSPQPTAGGPRLEEVADALLYLGPCATLTWASDVDLSQDRAFLEELKRRRELTGESTPLPAEAAKRSTLSDEPGDRARQHCPGSGSMRISARPGRRPPLPAGRPSRFSSLVRPDLVRFRLKVIEACAEAEPLRPRATFYSSIPELDLTERDPSNGGSTGSLPVAF